MFADAWRQRYRAALARARARAAAAEAHGELIACGLTNNVDLVVSLTDDVLARLLAGRAPNINGPRQTTAATPDELLSAIVQHVAAGEGVDIPVANAETREWLVSRVSGRHQLGGTGVQAANTLAVLGFSSLVHLTGCSPEQAAAFDRPERILVPRNGALLPVDRVARPDDPTMWHIALEFAEGTAFTLAGPRQVAPAGSRVIVSYDPVNSTFRLDHGYVASVLDRIAHVPTVLLSGYSQIVEPPFLSALVDDSLTAARRWRAASPEIEIHVELGAMPDPWVLAGMAGALATEVTSIGMNIDELRDLTTASGIRPAAGPADVRETLAALRRCLPVPRLNVHSASHAASITTGDPERERDALLFAALVASTRARIGRFPMFAELEETMAVALPHPAGLEMVTRLGAPDGIVPLGRDAFVIVPTIDVRSPAATVGLGDSFTAGLLAML